MRAGLSNEEGTGSWETAMRWGRAGGGKSQIGEENSGAVFLCKSFIFLQRLS